MPPGSANGFQSFVNNELPPAVAGDFAGANIRANVVASPWGFVAVPAGVIVGVGAWANPVTGLASNYYQPSSFPGFVHREGQALITTYLGIASMKIQPGDAVTVMDQGDFWGIFLPGSTPGQKVYFNAQDGTLTSGAAGGSVVGANAAGASIASGVLTTTDADQSGSALAVGQVITGPGIPPGTYIASADGTGSGTHLWNLANKDGTAIADIAGPISIANIGVTETQFYVASPVAADVSLTGSIAAPVFPAPYSVLTVASIQSGGNNLAAGQFLSGTGIPAADNLQIIAQLTGSAGAAGTYQISPFTVVGNEAGILATQGKLGKISSWSRST